ncbi:MAG: Ig-like domain-containing protein [Candidatus Borkfalkiaceae bacterium]|nr:Ig-like domain-containing protein [Clostridia bacterium]MDY6222968.1 Ig-like domain-containing protein [Christensenellaceae bacterium]
MKNFSKKALIVFLLALIGCFCCACGGDPSPQPEKPPPGNASGNDGNVRFYMVEKLEIKTYDCVAIGYTIIGSDEEIVWSSSDENVVTVENGKVTGISVGAAEVSAVVAGQKAICKVTVTENESFPCLKLTQTDAKPRVGGNVTVFAEVWFNGERTDYSEFSWTCENESIATVSEGRITGVSAGVTTVYVSAVYHGVLLSGSVTVTVVDTNS